MFMRGVPVVIVTAPRGNVQPFDEDDAIELLVVNRLADEHPGAIRVPGADHRSRLPRGRVVALGHAFKEVLFFYVTLLVDWLVGRKERIVPRHVVRQHWRRNGTGNRRIWHRISASRGGR